MAVAVGRMTVTAWYGWPAGEKLMTRSRAWRWTPDNRQHLTENPVSAPLGDNDRPGWSDR